MAIGRSLEQTQIPLETTLNDVFGFDAFRAGQKPAIEAFEAGRDVQVLMPTGAENLCASNCRRFAPNALLSL